jgi:hypothetical protein
MSAVERDDRFEKQILPGTMIKPWTEQKSRESSEKDVKKCRWLIL